MTEKQALKAVEKIINTKGAVYLAYRLGYKNSQTVEYWLKRQSVPSWCIERIQTILNEQEAVA